MAISTPPPLPGRRRAGFSDAVDAFVSWLLNAFVPELNAAITALNLNSTTGTSATSNAIGTGAKTFTADLNMSWQPGMWLVVADAAAPSTNWMAGPVTSYNVSTGALVISVLASAGSGTKTSWKISQSAPGGATLSGNKFLGVQQYDQSANIASGATVDLGAATGNSVIVTHSSGTTAITGFGAATALQAGTIIEVRFSISAGALSLTHNATSLDIPGGGNITLSDGDKIRLRKTSDTNAYWEVIDGRPLPLKDGQATLAKLDTSGNAGQNLAAQGGGLPPVWRDKFGKSAVIATTSGAAIDVTGIPSWANRITISFDDVSTTGVSPLLVQLGSGAIESSGYNSTGLSVQGSQAGANGATTGFQLSNTDGGAAWARRGCLTLIRKETTNIWIGNSIISVTGSTADRLDYCAGKKSISAGVLDRIRLTTLGGSDTFDAGSITINWE